MISIPFFHPKCAKWNTNHGDHGDHGADGAPEMQPQAAVQSPISRPDRARLPPSLYFGWLLLWGHLGEDENDFDQFFSPKMREMEHR